jgi:hypothetical protein
VRWPTWISDDWVYSWIGSPAGAKWCGRWSSSRPAAGVRAAPRRRQTLTTNGVLADDGRDARIVREGPGHRAKVADFAPHRLFLVQVELWCHSGSRQTMRKMLSRRANPPSRASAVALVVQGGSENDRRDVEEAHRQTVVRHLVRAGVELCRLGLTDEQVQTAERLYLDWLTLAEIADRFGMAASTIRSFLLQQALQLRPTARRRAA